MGFVWNVLLAFANDEWWHDGEDAPRTTCRPVERINRWLRDGKLVDLTGPTYQRGAGHGLDANLFGGGFAHVDIDAFVRVIEAQAWKNRAKVQLWVKGGEEGVGDAPFSPVRLRRHRRKKAQRQPRTRSRKTHRRAPRAARRVTKGR